MKLNLVVCITHYDSYFGIVYNQGSTPLSLSIQFRQVWKVVHYYRVRWSKVVELDREVRNQSMLDLLI